MKWYFKSELKRPCDGCSGGAYFKMEKGNPVIVGMHIGSEIDNPFDSVCLHVAEVLRNIESMILKFEAVVEFFW